MPTFERSIDLPFPRDALAAYHERVGAIQRLVPPWQKVTIVESAQPRDGSRAVIDLHLGPLKKRWVAEHFDVVPGERFRDRQVNGPFKSWTHTHTFADAPGGSRLTDHIEYEAPLAGLSEGFVRSQLDRMFAFRHARTRNDLAFATASPKTIAVSGASGAVASNLIPLLTTAGHRVRRLSRSGSSDADAIRWTPATGEVDEAKLGECDALVHLAGRNIAVRWTQKNWHDIETSRVDATRKLCETLARMPKRPGVLVCASATGYYGDRGDRGLVESYGRGDGRAAELCERWETATHAARDAGIRVVNLRIGVVISARSGALPKLLTPARLGLGGPLGGGHQFMPWIAIDDLIAAIELSLRDDRLFGPVNAVTESVRQREFAETLGRVLHRPAFVPTPKKAMTLAFGEMARELLLASARVYPARLRDVAFVPLFPTLESALRFELGRM